MIVATRRQALRCVVSGVLVWSLAGCSDDAPDQADALEQITQRIRQSFPNGERRVDNLSFVSGTLGGDGRYTAVVNYDLVTVMTSIDLFNTVNKPGESDHVVGERFVFGKTDKGWAVVK